MVKGILINLYKRLSAKQYVENDIRKKIKNYSDEKLYLDSLREPLNDSERSYYQFLCQRFIKWGGANSLSLCFLSALCLIPNIIRLRIRSMFVKNIGECELVVTHSFLKDLLPKEYEEFKNDIAISKFSGGVLTKQDLVFLQTNVFRHRNPFFIYKCLVRIASYSEIIRSFKPKIIFCSAEYSFTSSILTKYCEEHGIKHLNIQHGEKYLCIRDSFFRFHGFYIWDEYYKKMFFELRASKSKYIIEKMKLKSLKREQERKYCYYLELHSKDELKIIRKYLDHLDAEYFVRPHPVYAFGYEKEVFGEDKLEDTVAVNIWESIARTDIIISMSSTVLYQAYLLGHTVMIDDITRPDIFMDLKQRGFIMLSKPHILLSEYIDSKYVY